MVEPDLLWDDVRDLFDPESGHLPDVYASSTTSEDWQRVVDLVRSSGMAYRYQEDGHSVDLPSHVEVILDRQDVTVELWVWPAPEVLAIFRFLRWTRSTSTWTSGNCRDRTGWTCCAASLGRSGARLANRSCSSPRGQGSPSSGTTQ